MDTDVVVAALRSPRGASAALLEILDDGHGTLVLSVPLALESEAVCSLAEHRLASGLSEKQLWAFINGVIGMAEPVLIHFRWRPQLRDPGDEMVFETAINGHADAIVTFNSRDYGETPGIFGIELLLPGKALQRMRTT